MLDVAGTTDAIVELDDSFKRTSPRPSFAEFLGSRTDPLAVARLRLLNFLRSSDHIRTAAFLAKLGAVGEMFAEKALILGKVGCGDD